MSSRAEQQLDLPVRRSERGLGVVVSPNNVVLEVRGPTHVLAYTRLLPSTQAQGIIMIANLRKPHARSWRREVPPPKMPSCT
jgi:hypothetical protein